MSHCSFRFRVRCGAAPSFAALFVGAQQASGVQAPVSAWGSGVGDGACFEEAVNRCASNSEQLGGLSGGEFFPGLEPLFELLSPVLAFPVVHATSLLVPTSWML